MDSQQFVSSYRRDIPKHNLETGTSEVHKAARDQSIVFGRYLHDYLNGEFVAEVAEPYSEFQVSYLTWQHSVFLSHMDSLLQGTHLFEPESPAEDRQLQEINELTFHLLNHGLLPMWQSLLDPDMLKNPGHETITIMQGRLALIAMPLYSARSEFGDHYFKPESANKRATIEGVLTEIDAAITLLEVAKKQPYLHVLPSPYQFEHFRKNLNGDIMAVDKHNQTAIGVQVKSDARNTKVNTYDKNHTVIVDGHDDLENTIMRRPRATSSLTARFGWAGLISATVVRDLPTRGTVGRTHMQEHSLPWLMYQKQLTRRTAMNIRTKLPVASKRIESKLAPHLEIS